MRSVAHELGRDLGCGAHLSRLRRTRAGAFTLADAHTLEELEALAGNSDALESSVRSSAAFAAGDALRHRRRQALGRLRNGAQANLPEFSAAPLVKVFAGPRELVGIARTSGGNAVSAGGGDGVSAGVRHLSAFTERENAAIEFANRLQAHRSIPRPLSLAPCTPFPHACPALTP